MKNIKSLKRAPAKSSPSTRRGRRIPKALRMRVNKALLSGEKPATVARTFSISLPTAYSWRRQLGVKPASGKRIDGSKTLLILQRKITQLQKRLEKGERRVERAILQLTRVQKFGRSMSRAASRL